jgi:chorismate--pyruvate lyase
MTAVLSLNASWFAADTLRLPEKLQPWLLEPASLTARLKAHCQQFHLALLAETATELPDFLQACLPDATLACIRREVLMSCNQQPAVYAQSWLPDKSRRQLQQLAVLGEQPLGELLFQFSDLRRGPIEVAKLQLTQPTAGIAAGEYWARRSVFSVADAPLLVAEVFLPAVELL